MPNKLQKIINVVILAFTMNAMSVCLAAEHDDLKQFYHTAPLWNSNEISYSRGMENKASSISYEQWQYMPSDKYLYTHNKFKLFKQANKIPSDVDKKQAAAYVLGKIKLADGIDGLLVLENGYYSLTRIMIYPFDTHRNSWPGIEVADLFADEDEEVIIVSKTITDKQGIKIKTTVTKILYKEPELHSTKRTVFSKDVKKFLWKFEPIKGFLLMQ